MKPNAHLAFSFWLLLLTTPAMAAKPGCWQVQPGPTPDPGKVAWWYGGKKLLEIPASWDVKRAYQELESYGYCDPSGSGLKPETPATEPVQQVRSSAQIIKENLEKERIQNKVNTGSINWPVLLFLAGAGVAIFRAIKDDDDSLLKEKEKKDNRFFSGITQPSPWLLDQKPPVGVQSPSLGPLASCEPDAGIMREPSEPTSSQWFGKKFGKSSGSSEPGSEKSSEKVRSVSSDDSRRALEADSPYCIDDDDVFIKAVIRLGRKAGLKKGELMNHFYWLKPQGDTTYVKAIISKGENKNYERFNELYAEVECSDGGTAE